MNTDIINNFVQYYFNTFNDKTKFNEYMNMWKEYSTLVYNNISHTQNKLIDVLKHIYTCMIDVKNFQQIIISSMAVGDRRANVLLTYRMIDSNGQILNVSQYILLAYSNSKEYWIHSSLVNIL